jgi:SAM-dependent methyltransferase
MGGRAPAPPRFEQLTETTGIPLTDEAAEMMYTRYAVGARLADGKRVLELGCGAGQGLGLLDATANLTVGGDYSKALLSSGRTHYGDRVPLVRLSADRLPFTKAAFDVVLFFEASYYVPDMRSAFEELNRVLRPGGTVLFVNANPERPDFIPSPHSVHYHSADQFRAALEQLGMAVKLEGAFPVAESPAGSARWVQLPIAAARWLLHTLGLVPKTLRGRARLKRLVYRNLREVPPELPQGFAREAPRVPLGGGGAKGFKALYVSGTKAASG